MIVDYKNLKGETLYRYFEKDHPDRDYASVVCLLPLAMVNRRKALKILEQSVKENRKLIAVYPGVHKVNTSNLIYLGPIIDGALYMTEKASV